MNNYILKYPKQLNTACGCIICTNAIDSAYLHHNYNMLCPLCYSGMKKPGYTYSINYEVSSWCYDEITVCTVLYVISHLVLLAGVSLFTSAQRWVLLRFFHLSVQLCLTKIQCR